MLQKPVKLMRINWYFASHILRKLRALEVKELQANEHEREHDRLNCGKASRRYM